MEELEAGGFFARGGKVGVVFFSETATTAIAPTTNVSAIKTELAKGSPAGEGCISCGLQLASQMLAAVPGSSGHRRIAYIVADGKNTGTSPTVSEAVASAQAAGVERRVIGMGSEASGKGLEEFASSGNVAYTETSQQLASAFAAQSTILPGATEISWAFHLTPGFTPSAPTASVGSVAVAGGDVTWTIPSLGAQTATLSFHAAHDPAAGCAATTLLSGTTFSDKEGDATPSVSLGPISLDGCTAGGGGSGSSGGGGAGGGGGPVVSPHPSPPTASQVISLPKPTSACSKRHSIQVKFKPPAGTKVAKASVKVTGQKTKTYKAAQLKSAISITGLPAGRYKVTVTVKLSDGRSLTLTQSYKGCPMDQS